MEILQIYISSDFVVIKCKQSKLWMVCLDKKEFNIAKRIEIDHDLFVGNSKFVITGKNSNLYNFSNFQHTPIEPLPEQVEFHEDNLITYANGISYLYFDSILKDKIEGKLQFLTDSVFILYQQNYYSVRLVSELNSEISRIPIQSDLYIFNGVVLNFQNTRLSIVYPITKELNITMDIKDVQIHNHLLVTDGFCVYIYKLMKSQNDYLLQKSHYFTFPLLKYLEVPIFIQVCPGFVYASSENYILSLDLSNYEFSISKLSYLNNYKPHCRLPILYAHDNSTVSCNILSQNTIFEISSIYLKSKSDLLITDDSLISYTPKSIQFRNMYDLTLLAEYPFKLSDNTLFKICNRFLIVYTNKSLIVYRLYSFKVQDEYLSDKKILDVHYNELGLFILTSTGFYQFEKHDIYLDFSLSIAYEQFVIHYLDSIKGFVMFMSLQGYLIMYFTVVGNRLLVDHSKTVSIDFNHLTTRKWHVNVNALLEIEDGFLLFQMAEKLPQSCIGSFKSIEHGANSINALLNFLVDIELKAQYDINALQDVFEQQLNLVTNKHQTEQRIYKKSSNGTVKTISSKLKKLNDTHSTLETVQSNELRTLRETKESQVLQTIMQVEDESEQFIKETRQLLIKFEKDKTSEQAKFIEKLAQITTFHIRENNKLTTSLTGVVHSIDFCKEQEKILHFEKINLLKSSLSNYESNYEEQKKEIYPIKSLLTVLEKKRLNLLHSLDMLKIKSNRSLTAEKDLINKITAVKGQIIKFKLAVIITNIVRCIHSSVVTKGKSVGYES